MDYQETAKDPADYNSLIAEYTEAIALDPFDSAGYLCRGRIYTAQGRQDLAKTDYERAIGIDPDNAGAYKSRGDWYLAHQSYDFALADYNQALALDPDNEVFQKAETWAYYAQGYAAYVNKEYDKAEAAYQEALPQGCVPAHVGLGIIYMAKKDYTNAIEQYSQGIAIAPASAPSYRHRGNAYFAMLSDEEYIRAIRGPESRGIHEYQEKLREYQEKTARYEEELVKKDIKAVEEYVLQNERKKEYAAEEYKRELLESHKPDIENYERRIQDEAKQNIADYTNQAMEHFKERYAGDPEKYKQDLNDHEKNVSKGASQKIEAYRDQLLGDHAQDIADKERELEERYVQDREIHEKHLEKQREKDLGVYEKEVFKEFRIVEFCRQALDDYSHAIAFNPKYSAAYYDRGRFYYAVKAYDNAAADFAKALELNPHDPRPGYTLKQAREKQSE